MSGLSRGLWPGGRWSVLGGGYKEAAKFRFNEAP